MSAAESALDTLRPDGPITFATAISARMARPGTAGLAAINGALEAMIRPLAAALRVNAVSPGVIDTPWWDTVAADAKAEAFAQYAAATPVGRIGRPEEVAAGTVLLVGNGFMTGTVLGGSAFHVDVPSYRDDPRLALYLIQRPHQTSTTTGARSSCSSRQVRREALWRASRRRRSPSSA